MNHENKKSALLANLPGISPATQKVLQRLGVKELSDLAKWQNSDQTLVKPSERLDSLAYALRKSEGPDATRDSSNSIGPSRMLELFDAVVLYAVDLESKLASTAPASDDSSVQLLCALIRGTTGDLGGRHQARLFAEIACDYASALRAEKAKRGEHGQAFR